MSEDDEGKKSQPTCEVCACQPAIYTCPACAFRSCSAKCVKQHKVDSKCDGARKRTKFVGRDDLTEEHLRKDVGLLSDVLDTVERGRSVLTRVQGDDGDSSRHRRTLNRVVSEAKKRGCSVVTMPETLSKHQRNRSRYDAKEAIIMWTLEWFVAGGDIPVKTVLAREDATLRELLPDGVDKTKPVSVAIDLHMQPPSLVDLDQPIKDVLDGLTIIEFPTLRIMT